ERHTRVLSHAQSTTVAPNLFVSSFLFLLIPLPPSSTLFPYTTLFRSLRVRRRARLQRIDRFHSQVHHLMKLLRVAPVRIDRRIRSEEHTSELQSQSNLVCRLLLEKKKQTPVGQRSDGHTRTRRPATSG